MHFASGEDPWLSSVVTEAASTAVSGPGDFTLMVDPASPANTAYLAYDAWGNNHAVLIEQLTPVYNLNFTYFWFRSHVVW